MVVTWRRRDCAQTQWWHGGARGQSKRPSCSRRRRRRRRLRHFAARTAFGALEKVLSLPLCPARPPTCCPHAVRMVVPCGAVQTACSTHRCHFVLKECRSGLGGWDAVRLPAAYPPLGRDTSSPRAGIGLSAASLRPATCAAGTRACAPSTAVTLLPSLISPTSDSLPPSFIPLLLPSFRVAVVVRGGAHDGCFALGHTHVCSRMHAYPHTAAAGRGAGCTGNSCRAKSVSGWR